MMKVAIYKMMTLVEGTELANIRNSLIRGASPTGGDPGFVDRVG